MELQEKNKYGIKKLIKSFFYAFNGIFKSINGEQNIKIHFIVSLFVIIFGFILNISYIEWLVCLILFALVISLEMVNSAIEKLVDLVNPSINKKAGDIKDIAAGAVLFSAIMSAIIGCIIFIPKLIEFIGGLL